MTGTRNSQKMRKAVTKTAMCLDAAMRAHPYAILVVGLALVVLMMVIFPDVAWANQAASKGGGGDAVSPQLRDGTLLGRLQNFITYLFLPVGIAWASWQIIYIALVCGVIGIDPLGLIQGRMDQDRIWQEIRKRFKNFAFGLAWVAGIWALFETVLFLVSQFVGIIEKNF